VGPGWPPIGPQGNVNLVIFERLARGDEVLLPDMGLGQLHHVHAADVAQIYWRSIANWGASVGEAFHAVSPAALTLRGYCEAVAGWFGRKANLRYLPFDEWKTHVTEREAGLTRDHIAHSPSGSTEKARRALGYEPRYTSLEAIREALAWLVANGRVQAPPLG
jgi:nucleoside-diphosphate-sugar epimerase